MLKPLLLTAIVMLSACSKQNEPLNLAANTWLGYQPLYLIQARHACPDCTLEILPGQQLKITKMPSTTMVLRLFGAKKVDAAMLTLDEAVSFQSNTGIAICVAAVLSYSNGADAALVMPGFEASKESFKIGYEETALGGYMLHRIVEEQNWAAEKLQMQLLVPKNHVDTLLQGQVDMVITYEPYISQLRKHGAQVFFDSKALAGEIVDILVVQQTSWAEHRGLLQSLIANDWQEGVAALQNLSAAELAFLQKSTDLDATELAVALSGMQFFDNAQNQHFLAEKLPKVVAQMNDYLLSSKQISRPAELFACEHVDR
ncbi:nitrate ABC transporter [Alishewanella longhuensis]